MRRGRERRHLLCRVAESHLRVGDQSVLRIVRSIAHVLRLAPIHLPMRLMRRSRQQYPKVSRAFHPAHGRWPIAPSSPICLFRLLMTPLLTFRAVSVSCHLDLAALFTQMSSCSRSRRMLCGLLPEFVHDDASPDLTVNSIKLLIESRQSHRLSVPVSSGFLFCVL
jgi:hypothetical protein